MMLDGGHTHRQPKDRCDFNLNALELCQPRFDAARTMTRKHNHGKWCILDVAVLICLADDIHNLNQGPCFVLLDFIWMLLCLGEQPYI